SCRQRPALLNRETNELFRLWILKLLFIEPTDQGVVFSLCLSVGSQLVQACGAPVEQGHNGFRFRRSRLGVSVAEQIEKELLNTAGASRFGKRTVAFGSQPHGKERDQAGNDEKHEGSGRDRDTVSLNVLTQPISEGMR